MLEAVAPAARLWLPPWARGSAGEKLWVGGRSLGFQLTFEKARSAADCAVLGAPWAFASWVVARCHLNFINKNRGSGTFCNRPKVPVSK